MKTTSPYMISVAPVRKRLAITGGDGQLDAGRDAARRSGMAANGVRSSSCSETSSTAEKVSTTPRTMKVWVVLPSNTLARPCYGQPQPSTPATPRCTRLRPRQAVQRAVGIEGQGRHR